MAEDQWRTSEVWHPADDLASRVYEATKGYPKAEVYGSTSQLRRVALSIAANLVEGYSRKGRKELLHFVNICLGSLAETKHLIHFCRRLGHPAEPPHGGRAEGCVKLGQRRRFYETIRAKAE